MVHREATEVRRAELGTFLRTRRGRLRPDDVGLTVVGRRHVKGLRREEIAEAAGIGTSWYTFLEQGRPTNVSLSTLHRIADALRLDMIERQHLLELAGHPRNRPNPDRDTPPDALLAYVRAYPHALALLTNARLDVVGWNRPADASFGFSERAEDRNFLTMLANDDRCRSVFIDPTPTAVLHATIGQFRSAYAKFPTEEFTDLVRRLQSASSEFVNAWNQYAVAAPPTAVYRIAHPDLGVIPADVMTFAPFAAPTHTLTIMTPQAEHPARDSAD